MDDLVIERISTVGYAPPDGCLHLPDGPGLGVELDPAVSFTRS